MLTKTASTPTSARNPLFIFIWPPKLRNKSIIKLPRFISIAFLNSFRYKILWIIKKPFALRKRFFKRINNYLVAPPSTRRHPRIKWCSIRKWLRRNTEVK
jgi:hypothetical protein